MTLWLWISFIVLILVFLGLDLGFFLREIRTPKIAEAFAWTGLWISLALIFNLFVYHLYKNQWFGIGMEVDHALSGRQAALEFFTAYLIEYSLSLDNIFVFALIFQYFNVPLSYQHRVLTWGILGVLIMRALMIGIGTTLIQNFDWIVYIFGILLIFTAVKMLIARHDNLRAEANPLVKLSRKFMPVTSEFHSDRFFVRLDGRWNITPLFLVLLVVESTDIVFGLTGVNKKVPSATIRIPSVM